MLLPKRAVHFWHVRISLDDIARENLKHQCLEAFHSEQGLARACEDRVQMRENLDLEKLRHLLRSSCEMKCISLRQYEYVPLCPGPVEPKIDAVRLGLVRRQTSYGTNPRR